MTSERTTLQEKAIKIFNKYIRQRDKNLLCISCNKSGVQQAGHFYAAGHYNNLRFNEDNVHGQCLQCNYFKSGNQILYRINLEKKIGKERLEKLDILAAYNKRHTHRWDRIELQEIITKYKKLIKNE